MINLKKVMCLTVASIMVATIGIGCGSPKVKPEEVTKIALDVEFKGDKSQIDKINMNEDEFNARREKSEKSMKTLMGGENSSVISDEEFEELQNNILEGISKVDYEVGETKVDKDSATVNVNIKGMDLNEMLKTAQTKLTEDMTSNPTAYSTSDEITKKSYEILKDLVKDPVLLSEGTDIEVKLTKKDNAWVLLDPELTDVVTEVCKMK